MTTDHFATTKGMIMGMILGVLVTKFWVGDHPPVPSTSAPVGSMRMVANMEVECQPDESMIEIKSPGNNETVLVHYEHLTLASESEIHVSVGPVSKPTP